MSCVMREWQEYRKWMVRGDMWKCSACGMINDFNKGCGKCHKEYNPTKDILLAVKHRNNIV